MAAVVPIKPSAVGQVGGPERRLDTVARQHRRQAVRGRNEVERLRLAGRAEAVHPNHLAAEIDGRATAHAFRDRGVDLIHRTALHGRLLADLATLVRGVQRRTGHPDGAQGETHRKDRRADADVGVGGHFRRRQVVLFDLQQSHVPFMERPEVHDVCGQLRGELRSGAIRQREGDVEALVGGAFDTCVLQQPRECCRRTPGLRRVPELLHVVTHGIFEDYLLGALRVDAVTGRCHPTVGIHDETGAVPVREVGHTDA